MRKIKDRKQTVAKAEKNVMEFLEISKMELKGKTTSLKLIMSAFSVALGLLHEIIMQLDDLNDRGRA